MYITSYYIDIQFIEVYVYEQKKLPIKYSSQKAIFVKQKENFGVILFNNVDI